MGSVATAIENGIKTVLDSSGVLKLLDNSGRQVARITNNVLTFKYTGFGGDIVTTPGKTTTVIGKYDVNGVGTKNIIDSGLSKSGENIGGINVLDVNTTGMSSLDIWNNINKPWIQEAVNRGDIIRVVSDPTLASNLSNPSTFNGLSFFAMEHNFLTTPISQGGAGYTFDVINKLYKP